MRDLRLDLRSVQQMEALSHRRLAGSPALARAESFGSTEDVKKVRWRAIVPKLDGARATRTAGERLGRFRYRTDRVEQYFSRQSANPVVRSKLLIVLVRRI